MTRRGGAGEVVPDASQRGHAKLTAVFVAQILGISRQRLYRMLEEAGDVDLSKLRS